MSGPSRGPSDRRTRAVLLAAACVAQLALAVWTLAGAEATLGGRVYRFRTALVDPVDAFRGRYVALAFAPATVPLRGEPPFAAGETAYARVVTAGDGFALLESIHHAPPAQQDYLAVRVTSATASAVTVTLPFDRFYMEEQKAQETERALTTSQGRAWVLIRVRDGNGVIEALEPDPSERPLSAAELAARLLRVDESEPLPEALLEAILASSAGSTVTTCGKSAECVAFPVELDGKQGREYVLQIPGPFFQYFAPSDPAAGGAFHWAGLLQGSGSGRAAEGSALVALLRERGAPAVPPPYLDLRINEQVFHVTR